MASNVPTVSSSKISRVFIVDDSHLVRAGLRAVVEGEVGGHSLEICGEAASAKEALEKIIELRPDVVLLDIRLPDGHGYDVCRSIVAELPETKVLMLTAFTNDRFIYESILAGAHGYLMKEVEPEGLLQSIEDVLEGKSALSDQITEKMVQMMRAGGPADSENMLKMLSAQESRVLALVAQGRTNREIAAELNLSGNTVKNYLASVFDKLKLRRRSQAAAVWTKHHRETL